MFPFRSPSHTRSRLPAQIPPAESFPSPVRYSSITQNYHANSFKASSDLLPRWGGTNIELWIWIADRQRFDIAQCVWSVRNLLTGGVAAVREDRLSRHPPAISRKERDENRKTTAYLSSGVGE